MRSRCAATLVVLVGCGGGEPRGTLDGGGVAAADAAPGDGPAGVPLDGFGALGGDCAVLDDPELLGATPLLFRGTLTFERGFQDPADRPLLTDGGQRMIATPNAGGSSAFSEVFAYEQLARCELAALLKTETEIGYDQVGAITDLEVAIDLHKIGVSVVRAMTFPLGNPYTVDAAMPLLQRKLEDIQESSAHVTAADRWEKQILAVVAYDDQHADVVEQVWAGLDVGVRADTLLVVTVTHGDDTFLYVNP